MTYAAVVAIALATAGCSSQWGPLAVARADSGDMARTEGTLVLTAKCAFIDQGGQRMMLVWPEARTTWDSGRTEVRFRGLRGEIATSRSGQHVVLGGGESGKSLEWVAAPDEACLTESWWFVSDMELDGVGSRDIAPRGLSTMIAPGTGGRER